MGIAASLFFSTANPDECLDYRIRPSDEQYDAQKERWNSLAEHLFDDLNSRSGYPIYSWLQGSYKFGTQVRPAHKGMEFDIDLGVYFRWPGAPEDGNYAPNEFKDFVQVSLEEYADDEENDAEGVSEPKLRCNRIHFSGDFHIDVPAYHLDAARDARSLATMDGEWEDSDPKAIYIWWKESVDETQRSRARRLVRYLKMWASLKLEDECRPSSILLTVLVAESLLELETADLRGDDEFLRATVTEMRARLYYSTVVLNPANSTEDLNRLSENGTKLFIDALDTFISIAERALAAPSKLDSADIWSEAFDHFFPMPSEEEILEAATGKALVPIRFDPEVLVRATTERKVFEKINQIGPIPKGCMIEFSLANSDGLPDGAVVTWVVRNSGQEAEAENDLGHKSQSGLVIEEHSAYRGKHQMDVSVRLNGRIIGFRRVPVTITGLGMPRRNPTRPSWTKFRKRK